MPLGTPPPTHPQPQFAHTVTYGLQILAVAPRVKSSGLEALRSQLDQGFGCMDKEVVNIYSDRLVRPGMLRFRCYGVNLKPYRGLGCRRQPLRSF